MKSEKTIIITGGSTGIGFACAEYLLYHGYKVIITGKSKENLDGAVMKLGGKRVFV